MQPVINVKPETTDSFDLGARYIAGRFQAQGTFWKINYQNRIVTSFDPETNISIDRNVGKVNSWGFDAGVGVKPIRAMNLIGLLSYTDAKLKDDVIIRASATTAQSRRPINADARSRFICSPLPTTGTATVQVCGRTTGKFVVETPKWQYGGRVELHVKPVTLGLQAKHVGKRFATDVNDVVVNSYTTVDADARIDLADDPGQQELLPAQRHQPVQRALLREPVDDDQCVRCRQQCSALHAGFDPRRDRDADGRLLKP